MPTDPTGRYRGRNFDPEYKKHKRPLPPPEEYNGFRNDVREKAWDGWDSNSDPSRGPSRPCEQSGQKFERDREDGYGSDRPSSTRPTPRGPRESRPPKETQSVARFSPKGVVHHSRLSSFPDEPPLPQKRDQSSDTPALTSQSYPPSKQPVKPTSPPGSLPSGASLGSLDKLRQFKAEVEATRRQRQPPELEPGKLARMAESFLRAQQHEPGEVFEDPSQEEPASPKTREQELKNKLRQRMQSHETDSLVGVKREAPESGEILETSAPKRPRAEEPSRDRSRIDVAHARDRSCREEPFREGIEQRFGIQAPSEVARRPADPPTRPRKRSTGEGVRQPSPQKRSVHSTTIMGENMTAPPAKTGDNHLMNNTTLRQLQSSVEPRAQDDRLKRLSSSHLKQVVEHGNHGRFTLRDGSPSYARRDSSIFERRSMSQRISEAPSHHRRSPSPELAMERPYRGRTRQISPPRSRQMVAYERQVSPHQRPESRQSASVYSSRRYDAPPARELVPSAYGSHSRSPPYQALPEPRSAIAEAYAYRVSTMHDRSSQEYTPATRAPRQEDAHADPYPNLPSNGVYRRPVPKMKPVGHPVALDSLDVVETLAALKAQISKLEALVPMTSAAPASSSVREKCEPYPPPPPPERTPAPQMPREVRGRTLALREDYSRLPPPSYDLPSRTAHQAPSSSTRGRGRGPGRGGYDSHGHEERSSGNQNMQLVYDLKEQGYDNRKSGSDRGGGRGNRGVKGGGRGGRGRGGGGYGSFGK